MSYVLFHIPHASLKITKMYYDICVKDDSYIRRSNLFLSDYLVDQFVPPRCHKITFPYSRLFCDVERFKDDNVESMSKYGMGVIYTRDLDSLIAKPSAKYRRRVISSYYDKHHNKLDKVVTVVLNRGFHSVIVDLHSYSDEMVMRLFSKSNNPDICIGVDERYTNSQLVDFTVSHFKSYGYTVSINYPYAGTIIPNKYFHKHCPMLHSIMLEINKRIYLTNYSDFMKLKMCIEEYYKKIQVFDF